MSAISLKPETITCGIFKVTTWAGINMDGLIRFQGQLELSSHSMCFFHTIENVSREEALDDIEHFAKHHLAPSVQLLGDALSRDPLSPRSSASRAPTL